MSVWLKTNLVVPHIDERRKLRWNSTPWCYLSSQSLWLMVRRYRNHLFYCDFFIYSFPDRGYVGSLWKMPYGLPIDSPLVIKALYRINEPQVKSGAFLLACLNACQLSSSVVPASPEAVVYGHLIIYLLLTASWRQHEHSPSAQLHTCTKESNSSNYIYFTRMKIK